MPGSMRGMRIASLAHVQVLSTSDMQFQRLGHDGSHRVRTGDSRPKDATWGPACVLPAEASCVLASVSLTSSLPAAPALQQC